MNITNKCLNALLVFVVVAHVMTVGHAGHLRAQEEPPAPDQICKTCMMLYDPNDNDQILF